MREKRRKTELFGLRLDVETAQKLQELAEMTDRTQASVIRTLIKLASVAQYDDLWLPLEEVMREIQT